MAKNIFPIIGKNYWFISSYLVMYFLSPFLNHFIRNADYKRHMSNILILLCCFSLPQLIPHVRWMASEGKIEMFVLLYITGALIKKYNLFNSEKQKLVTIIMVMLFVLVISEKFFHQSISLFAIGFCFMCNYRSTEVILCRTPSKANIIQAVKLV